MARGGATVRGMQAGIKTAKQAGVDMVEETGKKGEQDGPMNTMTMKGVLMREVEEVEEDGLTKEEVTKQKEQQDGGAMTTIRAGSGLIEMGEQDGTLGTGNAMTMHR